MYNICGVDGLLRLEDVEIWKIDGTLTYDVG